MTIISPTASRAITGDLLTTVPRRIRWQQRIKGCLIADNQRLHHRLTTSHAAPISQVHEGAIIYEGFDQGGTSSLVPSRLSHVTPQRAGPIRLLSLNARPVLPGGRQRGKLRTRLDITLPKSGIRLRRGFTGNIVSFVCAFAPDQNLRIRDILYRVFSRSLRISPLHRFHLWTRLASIRSVQLGPGFI